MSVNGFHSNIGLVSNDNIKFLMRKIMSSLQHLSQNQNAITKKTFCLLKQRNRISQINLTFHEYLLLLQVTKALTKLGLLETWSAVAIGKGEVSNCFRSLDTWLFNMSSFFWFVSTTWNVLSFIPLLGLLRYRYLNYCNDWSRTSRLLYDIASAALIFTGRNQGRSSLVYNYIIGGA